MARVIAFLTFDGNCREAMNYYKQCLGGNLSFQTVGESPLSEKMPLKMKKCILSSSLINEDLVLIGSDMVGENGLLKGNAVSMMINCTSEKEARVFYKKLSAGGQAICPLEVSFWGALFGELIDKYGNRWILNYNQH